MEKGELIFIGLWLLILVVFALIIDWICKDKKEKKMSDIKKFDPTMMMMANLMGQVTPPPSIPQVQGGFFLTDHIKNAKAERILKNVTLNTEIMVQYARGVKAQIEAMQNMATASQQVTDFNDQLTHNKNMRDLERMEKMFKVKIMETDWEQLKLEHEKMKKEVERDSQAGTWA